MNKTDLLKLADLLESYDFVPDLDGENKGIEFNLCEWFVGDAVLSVREHELHGCGAVCCAVGFAALHGIAGLRILPLSNIDGHHAPEDWTIALGDGCGNAAYDVAKAFGISVLAEGWLFLPDEYPDGACTTPAQVAARIRQFVETDGVIG